MNNKPSTKASFGNMANEQVGGVVGIVTTDKTIQNKQLPKGVPAVNIYKKLKKK